MSSFIKTKGTSAEVPKNKKILITAALPYANGAIHIGHMLEHIQADTWARTQKMLGHEVVFLCAEDAHGTAIMLRAEKEGKSPEVLITQSWEEHFTDFKAFSINFDNYHSTHSSENRQLIELYYERLNKEGLIEQKIIKQAYDPVKLMFLADRFIKGNCPKCDAKEQYGDSCEVCGAIYSPTDMKNAYSIFSNSKPILRESQHYFFKLSDPRCQKILNIWVNKLTQIEVKNKLKEWLSIDSSGKSKLQDWDISRDAPYFGFEIPNAPGKFFYVWVDAPIGYFASLQNLCEKRNFDFEDWTKIDSQVEQYHFIGKDILYFHGLFWPAMCFGAGLRLPTNIYVHGFLTVDGQKMSKSRGTFITARSYLQCGLDPDALRYYICAKLNGTIADIDLNLSDFTDRINSDLIGKFVNIASRTSKFITNQFDGEIEKIEDNELLKTIRSKVNQVKEHLIKLEYTHAVREIMLSSDLVNVFIDMEKPWSLKCNKEDQNINKLKRIVATSIEAFRLISIMLKPIVPSLVRRIEEFLVIDPLSWDSVNTPLPLLHHIKPYQHLMKRIDKEEIETLLKVNNQHLLNQID